MCGNTLDDDFSPFSARSRNRDENFHLSVLKFLPPVSHLKCVPGGEGAVRTVPLWPGTGVCASAGVTARRKRAMAGWNPPASRRDGKVWSSPPSAPGHREPAAGQAAWVAYLGLSGNQPTQIPPARAPGYMDPTAPKTAGCEAPATAPFFPCVPPERRLAFPRASGAGRFKPPGGWSTAEVDVLGKNE